MYTFFAIATSGKMTQDQTLRTMQDNLNCLFEKQQYGEGLKKILIGIDCSEPIYQQLVKKGKPKYIEGPKKSGNYVIEKTLEFDVILDYNQLSILNEQERASIMASALSTELNLTLDVFKKKIKDFDFERFKEDFRKAISDKEFILALRAANPEFDAVSNWQANNRPTEITKTNLSTSDQLNAFIIRKKFTPKDSSPSFSDKKLAPTLSKLMDNIANDFVRIFGSTKSDYEYQEAIKYGLAQFEPYRQSFDTEDQDLVCKYVEELMDIVGLESSGGHVNQWRYGFDPGGLK